MFNLSFARLIKVMRYIRVGHVLVNKTTLDSLEKILKDIDLDAVIIEGRMVLKQEALNCLDREEAILERYWAV